MKKKIRLFYKRGVRMKKVNKKTIIFIDRKFQLENEIEYLQKQLKFYKFTAFIWCATAFIIFGVLWQIK
jgi:pimeloyl-CoA synthetase